MYGVVVMLALSGSAEAPEFGRKGCRGCNGCNGCYGAVYNCNGCGGWSHGGCSGCGGWSYGGCSGCSGWSHGGCSGWSHGCSGVYHGCSGVSHGCSGAIEHHGCGGVYHSGVIEHGGSIVMPRADGKKPDKQSNVDANRATVVVSLPASASLVIDDYTTPSAQTQHTYITSALNDGETRTISFKANVMHEGKQQTLSKQVTVKPGQALTVNLAEGASVAAK